jgi:hypothetical protein
MQKQADGRAGTTHERWQPTHHLCGRGLAGRALLRVRHYSLAKPSDSHGRRGVGDLPGDGGQPGDCRRMSGGRAEGVDS